jgi:serine/threonine-protein kinase RsbW
MFAGGVGLSQPGCISDASGPPDSGTRAAMRLAVQLPAVAQAAGDARRLIREHFADRLPAVVLYDLLTVVSELITNAVVHGEGDAVGLAVEFGPDETLRGVVENDGRARIELRPIDLTGPSGTGLHIVDAIVDSWQVTTGPVTRVSFQLRAST